MPLNTNLIYRVVYSPTSFVYAVPWDESTPSAIGWYATTKQAQRASGRTEVVVVSEDEFETMLNA
jgi:hypothetical protein